MLDVTDFSGNPAAPELGGLGVCQVRFGKAMRGSPPRRRAVAAVMPWAVEALEQYLTEVRPRYEAAAHPAVWLTERGGRISPAAGRRPVRAVADGGRAAAGVVGALLAPLLCLAPDRGRGRPAVRAAAGRAFLGVDDRGLYPGRGATRRTGCCAPRWMPRSARECSEARGEHRRWAITGICGR